MSQTGGGLTTNLRLPPLQFLLFQPPCSHPTRTPFSPPPPVPLSPMIREAVLSEISNPTVRRKENDEWYREKEMLRMAKREKSLPLSFLSRGTGQVPTSMYFTVWLGGHRVCWPVMHGVMSLCPCPHFFFFFYPAKLMIMMMTMRKRRRRKNGTLRTWLGCSWYRFIQRRNAIAVCGHHAFSSRLPCRCCNRPDSRRQISPTSFEKHNFCKEKKKRCKFNPSGSFNLSSQECNKPQ